MLREKLKGYKIILASASPRRQQFFKDLDVNFEIRIKEVEEIYPTELQGKEITDFLARLKADAFKGAINSDEILVTSDTIVWHQGKALGKPKDYDDAVQILEALSGSTHKVITSVCFTTNEGNAILHDVTKVTFSALSKEDIAYYLLNYKPYDKAGAYGIQDWIGLTAVAKIEGSYTNVMGLPTEKVYRYLNEFKQ